ncbi:hypothetical protein DICVIV_02372 [Dictyocaulus viviparus]|uniref:Uncharacterized protein n=1 Tax=Dictyocaulus viviparus TaxID=29172 RepID=A0A0D8Y413_DICVI|nr:hypothetical protein DICVIV_02372 [Dictyocaulus viviparus]
MSRYTLSISIDLVSIINDDCLSALQEPSNHRSPKSSPVPIKRLNDFKQILKRFQENSAATNKEVHYPRRFITNQTMQNSSTTKPTHRSVEAWSPMKESLPGDQRRIWSPIRVAVTQDESWRIPAQRKSLNSVPRSSSTSRDTSSRSRRSTYSIQSPSSYLLVKETSPSCMTSPPLPCRISTPSSSEHESIHSPLSHSSSITEAVNIVDSPLHSITQKPKRKTIPDRWVKESDVDDPTTFYLSPVETSAENIRKTQSFQKVAIQCNVPLVAMNNSKRLPPNPKSAAAHYGGSCRKVLSDINVHSHPLMKRRSHSREKPSTIELTTSSIRSSKNGTRPPLHSTVFFTSNENASNGINRFSSKMASEKSLFSSSEDVHKIYYQMTLSHVQTLSIVADRLVDDIRRDEEPISRNQLGQLEFSNFVITSPHPLLTKGKSLFYNALLPRPGNSDYLVTLMIASYSQYAPMMRRSGSQVFMLPGFLELEDVDGSVKKFLHDTGTPNLDGRHTKVIAMPRLNLCSFHSLAAHHLNEKIDSTLHEQLVSFILLQLLTALKMLQSDGVESLSTNFKEFLLAYRFAPGSQQELLEFPRLIFLPETLAAEIESGGDELVGLCRYAMRALCTLLHHRMDGKPPPIQIRSRYSRSLMACANLLQEDKSSSLTKAKNVLEVALWGGEPCHTDIKARIWLDMARAECVDSLLRQLVLEPGCRLGICEHYQVEFLLTATPRCIVDSHKAILSIDI